jgi:hypothetical protein
MEAFMQVLAVDGFEKWLWGAFVALVALLTAVLVPGALSWAVVLGLGLIGVAIATVALVRSRRAPSLAQVITDAQSEIGRPQGAPPARSEIGRAVSALTGAAKPRV